MKIQLERTLLTCPKKLVCTVLATGFEVGKIRMLLYNDRGLLLGDVSPDCLKLSASEIRSTLRDQACALLQDAEGVDRIDDAAREQLCCANRHRALELLQAAQEDVRFPSALDWWFKKFEIFSEESQEVEAARMGLTDYYVLERSRLQKMLDDDRV